MAAEKSSAASRKRKTPPSQLEAWDDAEFRFWCDAHLKTLTPHQQDLALAFLENLIASRPAKPPRRPKRWTPRRIKELQERHAAHAELGMTPKQSRAYLARLYGIKDSQVRAHLKTRG